MAASWSPEPGVSALVYREGRDKTMAWLSLTHTASDDEPKSAVCPGHFYCFLDRT